MEVPFIILSSIIFLLSVYYLLWRHFQNVINVRLSRNLSCQKRNAPAARLSPHRPISLQLRGKRCHSSPPFPSPFPALSLTSDLSVSSWGHIAFLRWSSLVLVGPHDRRWPMTVGHLAWEPMTSWLPETDNQWEPTQKCYITSASMFGPDSTSGIKFRQTHFLSINNKISFGISDVKLIRLKREGLALLFLD